MSNIKTARLIALVMPMALLGGALIGQYGFGLFPCEMCWWQRYPHGVAVIMAAYSCIRPPQRVAIALAGAAIAVSGAIGLFHAGVEYSWWQGFTDCTSYVAKSDDPLTAIMNAPMIRCDVAQWSLFGISLAGWNFLFSGAAAAAIFGLLARGDR